jgi:hypothetical protein
MIVRKQFKGFIATCLFTKLLLLMQIIVAKAAQAEVVNHEGGATKK